MSSSSEGSEMNRAFVFGVAILCSLLVSCGEDQTSLSNNVDVVSRDLETNSLGIESSQLSSAHSSCIGQRFYEPSGVGICSNPGFAATCRKSLKHSTDDAPERSTKVGSDLAYQPWTRRMVGARSSSGPERSDHCVVSLVRAYALTSIRKE